jgi:hypothetical protein
MNNPLDAIGKYAIIPVVRHIGMITKFMPHNNTYHICYGCMDDYDAKIMPYSIGVTAEFLADAWGVHVGTLEEMQAIIRGENENISTE